MWLSHTDADPIGSLTAIMAEVPNARIITTHLGMGRMGLLGYALNRVYLLNPGQRPSIDDRELEAIKPPS